MKQKVGIVSCYFKHNYGSMLQAYATQQILDNMGIENETINVDENIHFINGKKKYYITQIANLSFIKSKLGMIKLKFDKKLKKDLGKNIAIRDKKYEEFKKEFRLTKPYKTYKELNEECTRYSDIIVGSDQLWLPVNVIADYYTLNWVEDKINKISLATSFGVSKIHNKYKEKYSKFLNRIENLSVREYILCYFLGKSIEHRKFAEKLKQKTGYKIVSLNHADEYVKYSDIFADETPYDIGPRQWINLIENAEYVCTDSFHGTIFSLINNKNFFTFERYNSKNSKISTNSRIYSLLETVQLKERLIKRN